MLWGVREVVVFGLGIVCLLLQTQLQVYLFIYFYIFIFSLFFIGPSSSDRLLWSTGSRGPWYIGTGSVVDSAAVPAGARSTSGSRSSLTLSLVASTSVSAEGSTSSSAVTDATAFPLYTRML